METGIFRWRVGRGGTAQTGCEAGSTNQKNGYRYIRIDLVDHLAHRLAWLYVNGGWPLNDIDHVNGNRTDNRFHNLRAATRSQNLANKRQCGPRRKGVGFDPRRGCYYPRIQFNRKTKYLGRFDSEEAAHAAYMRAADLMHGEFARAA